MGWSRARGRNGRRKKAFWQRPGSHLLAGQHRLWLPQLQGGDGGGLDDGEGHRRLLVVLGSRGDHGGRRLHGGEPSLREGERESAALEMGNPAPQGSRQLQGNSLPALGSTQRRGKRDMKNYPRGKSLNLNMWKKVGKFQRRQSKPHCVSFWKAARRPVKALKARAE